MAQRVKNLPAMQETQVQSLSWEDPLEDMATDSSILTWRIHGQRSLEDPTVHGVSKGWTLPHGELGVGSWDKQVLFVTMKLSCFWILS